VFLVQGKKSGAPNRDGALQKKGENTHGEEGGKEEMRVQNSGFGKEGVQKSFHNHGGTNHPSDLKGNRRGGNGFSMGRKRHIACNAGGVRGTKFHPRSDDRITSEEGRKEEGKGEKSLGLTEAVGTQLRKEKERMRDLL